MYRVRRNPTTNGKPPRVSGFSSVFDPTLHIHASVAPWRPASSLGGSTLMSAAASAATPPTAHERKAAAGGRSRVLAQRALGTTAPIFSVGLAPRVLSRNLWTKAFTQSFQAQGQSHTRSLAAKCHPYGSTGSRWSPHHRSKLARWKIASHKSKVFSMSSWLRYPIQPNCCGWLLHGRRYSAANGASEQARVSRRLCHVLVHVR